MTSGPTPATLLRHVRDAARTQLWPLPTLGVLLAVALGIALPRLDLALGDGIPTAITDYLFTGGPGSARIVLQAVAGSMITVTALTFSLTVVTLQLASSQYSPRLLRTFTRDLVVQSTLALFLGTFAYALTVLRTVRSSDEDRTTFVPNISVTFGFALAVTSVVFLVLFLAHLVRTIRVESLMRSVHRDASATAVRELEDSPAPEVDLEAVSPAGAGQLVLADATGFLVSVNEETLLEAAVEADAVVVVTRRPGGSIIAGTPVATCWATGGGPVPEELPARVSGALVTGFERTAVQDVSLGLRLLTDVAVKALSPGINDPTTAVHVLGHLSSLLGELVTLRLGPKLLHDEDGTLRVVLDRPGLADLLELATGQPARYGAAEPAVLDRILVLLAEVAWLAQPHQHRAIADRLARLRRTVAAADLDDADRAELERSAQAVETALAGGWTPRHGR